MVGRVYRKCKSKKRTEHDLVELEGPSENTKETGKLGNKREQTCVHMLEYVLFPRSSGVVQALKSHDVIFFKITSGETWGETWGYIDGRCSEKSELPHDVAKAPTDRSNEPKATT